MQVQISFDTEKESVEDLKKLAMAIQDLVAKREKQLGVVSQLPAASQQLQANNCQQQQFQQKPIPKDGKTAGGGRIVPYEDLSRMMDKIFSSSRRKR